jgi:streptogramin lyase
LHQFPRSLHAAGIGILVLILLTLPLARPASGQSSASDSPTVTITEMPAGSPTSQFGGLAAGPDGALWIADYGSKRIKRATLADGRIASVVEYPTTGGPADVAFGADGALWFAEPTANMIGRLTMDGALTEYLVPTTASRPTFITRGPDGAMWFTEMATGKIGRVILGSAGAPEFTEYLVPHPTCPSDPFNPAPCDYLGGIAPGPDGAMWFVEPYASRVGRITTSGAVTQYPLPTGRNPATIAAGPDGAMWFTELASDGNIGRVSMDGAITRFPLPTYLSMAWGITAGPDGAMWYTEFLTAKIGRITEAGVVTEFPLPTTRSSPSFVIVGPDGALWFVEHIHGSPSFGRLGRAALSSSTSTASPTASVSAISTITPTASTTSTATPTATESPTSTPTHTPTPTPTNTVTQNPTATATNPGPPTRTGTPTRTPTPCKGGRCALSATPTPTATVTPTAVPPVPGVVYVDSRATGGGNNGTSWANAFLDLQSGLAAATAGKELWVAQGTYTPTAGTDRAATFLLRSAVGVDGGFDGTETSRNQRDWTAHRTVLSGDIGVPHESSDNSYHVVSANGVDATAVLDGFTISGGNADGPPSGACGAACGGGLSLTSSSITLRNLTVTGNRASSSGGGLANVNSAFSNPGSNLSDVRVIGNGAARGGGIYNQSAKLWLIRSTLTANTGTGAGLYNASGNVSIWNTVLSGNGSPSTDGGAVYSDRGFLAMINSVATRNQAALGGALFIAGDVSSSVDIGMSTIAGNTAMQGGGGVWATGRTVQVISSILSSNTAPVAPQMNQGVAVMGSDIQGSGGSFSWDTNLGSDGGTNIDADPLFIDLAAGDVRVQAASPVINRGVTSRLPADFADLDGDGVMEQEGIPVDLGGNPRVVDGSLDMGAYETATGALFTPTRLPTSTSELSGTPTATLTRTGTTTSTVTPPPTLTASPSLSATATNSPTSTLSPSTTATPTGMATLTAAPTRSPTLTPSPTRCGDNRCKATVTATRTPIAGAAQGGPAAGMVDGADQHWLAGWGARLEAMMSTLSAFVARQSA